MTPSEKYVSELCGKSFLPFWSFPNPIGKKNKELCDVLIICENIIIIISVKDINVSNNNNEEINYERWVKKSIINSVKQIYGAERHINSTDEILLNDRKTKIKLPEKSNRIIYRIAIAFGGKSNYSLPNGEFGNGYVSVFDKKSTSIILSELDTITDFANYLSKKEKFLPKVVTPTEADFLALYLQTDGLNINNDPKKIFFCENDDWKHYVETTKYKRWKKAIADSYIWDFMIQLLFDFHKDNKILNETRQETEQAIRLINLETRTNRIVLGNLLSNAIKEKVSARMLHPLENSNHSYVFMPIDGRVWNEEVEGELILRCDVARFTFPKIQKVVGIAFGNDINKKFRFNICMIDIPEIDDDFTKHVNKIQNELGFFKNTKIRNE